MKRVAIISLFLSLTAAAISQNQGNDILGRLGLTEQDLERIELIQRETNRVILPARTEIQLIQADLSYLLSRDEVEMGDVEELLRSSLEYELAIRMAEIKMQIQIRESLGRDAWTKLMQSVGRYRQAGNLAEQITRAPIGSLQRRLLEMIRGMVRN